MGKQPALSACTWVLGSGQAGFSRTLGRSLSWLPHHICMGGQCPGAISQGGLGMGRSAYAMPHSRQDQDANASLQLSQRRSHLLLPGPSIPSHARAMLTLAGAMHALAGACGIWLSRLCWGGGWSRASCGCSWHASLCTGSCVPAQSYSLHAASTRIWAPSPSYFQVSSSFTPGFPFPQP